MASPDWQMTFVGWNFFQHGLPHQLVPQGIPRRLVQVPTAGPNPFLAANGVSYGAQVTAAMVGTAKPCPGCQDPNPSYPCRCGSCLVVPTKATHDLPMAVWRQIQTAMCGVLFGMIPLGHFLPHRNAGSRFLVLFRSVTDWIADLEARSGMIRLAPWNQPYVDSDAHPITGARSTDPRTDRRLERIAMNRLRHQMMNWGHSWIAKVGGDVQHQVAYVAMHYIYLMDCARNNLVAFDHGLIMEYR